MSQTQYTGQDAIDRIYAVILNPSDEDLADPELIAQLATFISDDILDDFTKAMVCIDLVRAYDRKAKEQSA